MERTIRTLKTKVNLEFIKQPHRGPSAARNAGAKVASGRILAFTDDDCLPDRYWLATISAGVSERSLLGGKTVNCLTNNIYSQASQLLVDYLYDYYASNNQAMRFFCTNNMACERDSFIALGGFNERFTTSAAEDREFCRRWIASVGELVYEPNAVVQHGHNLTFGRFCKQHFKYGKGAFTFHSLAARSLQSDLKIEPRRFYSDLVLYPWRSKQINPLELMFLLLTAQVANAGGFFFEAARMLGAQRQIASPNEEISTLPRPIKLSKSVEPQQAIFDSESETPHLAGLLS